MGLDNEPSSSSVAFPDFEDQEQEPAENLRSPSRFEAETLADIFFKGVGSYGCPIDRLSFEACMDQVYGDAWSGFQYQANRYSMNMTRFHVFIVMAIGMRMKTNGRTSEVALLERCYQLAMQQTSSPTFWGEAGGIEAALLLSVFSRVSTATSLM